MAEIQEIKLFGKWSLEEVEIQDISLVVSAFRPVALRVVSSDVSV